MLHISVSNVKCNHESQALKFHEVKLNSLDDLRPIITTPSLPWSPNIFSDGHRHGKSFCRCDLLVFDYDDGNPTLNEAIKIFSESGYEFMIGTTKSHQKEKKLKTSNTIKPPVDRFRVIVPAEGFADNILQFNYQMKRVAKSFYGIDSSCAEGARFYWPCKEIVCHKVGKSYKAVKPISADKIIKKIQQLKQSDIELGKTGFIPHDILAFMKYGIAEGQRRPSLFKFAAKLTRYGWPKKQIMSKLLEAPFYKEDLKIDDMMRQIERGILYGKGNEGYSI